jgi:type I restriction enzyme S subunit
MESPGRHIMVNALRLKQTESEIRPVELPEDEVKWCTVSLHDVTDAGMRLEASVFDIEGKQARERIYDCKWGVTNLLGSDGLVANAFYPGRFKRIYNDSLYGILFFLPSQMTDIYPKPDKYISALTKCSIEELRLKKGDILLTRSGTVGSLTLVSKTLEGAVFSDDVIRITAKREIDIGFLYAFLKSPTGNTILQTNKYGSVITHIEPEHLAGIPVPNPPDDVKKRINDLIIRSFELRDALNEHIDKAVSLLVAELQLPPVHEFKTKRFDKKLDVDNYTVKLSNLSGRLDGSYHVPIVNAITDHLRKFAAELITVGDERASKEIILPGRFKRVYVEEGQGRVFFGGKQLFELDPSNKKYLSLAKHSKRIKEQLELQENMVLITCSGTIGKVTIVPKHWNHWTANQHIIRVLPANDEMAGYMFIFLSSDYGYHLIKRYTYGSVVDEIDDNHVSRIPFPLLKNKSIQTKINELALEANKMRYEAYILEQKAMTIVNDEVIYART